MKKGDIAVAITVLFVALISALFPFHLSKDNGEKVIVKKNNQTVYEGKLDVDDTVDLVGNVIVIKDKEVYMKSANCKNGLCVRHKKISKAGESIVCLPNKVTVEIK